YPGSPLGVGLNGMRLVQPTPLSAGDVIQIGTLQLQFLMKSGAAHAAQEARARGVPVGAVPSAAPSMSPVAGAPTQAMAPIPAPAAGDELVVVSGPLAGRRISVTAEVEIGRQGRDLALSHDSNASRRHALVSPSPSGLVVTDLQSTNGTFVNGVRITGSAPLPPGSVARIGSTEIRAERRTT
ncbi:MAG: FHA domain-containing protein, partial [Fimbriimonadaceae bacterium]|nr:FHA domain-containing protein [Fimbriimonadaceae bacterium]